MPRLVRPRLLEMDVVVHTNAQKVPIGKRAAALRWRTSHRLGIPREPFKVYQRPVSTPLPRHSVPLLSTSVSLGGPRIVEWGRVPLMEAVVQASPNTGQTLTFQALDDRGEPIPGEVASVTRGAGTTSPMVATLRSPNICSILANGHGVVLGVSGSTMSDVVNDSAWTLLENVGLPFGTNVTPTTVYDSRPVQGVDPFGRTGFQAATERLNVAKTIYIGPSGFVSGGVSLSAPTWTEPSTALILSVITSGTSCLLQQIRLMLADTAATGTRQAAYRRAYQVSNFKQPGAPAGPNQDPARFDLGVAGMALLAAATDTWTALALGFGTTAFPTDLNPPPPPVPPPPRLAPDGAALATGPQSLVAPQPVPAVDMEYMVTARVRRADGQTVELAAVASLVRFPVVGPSLGHFQARTLRRHRPLLRDQAPTEDVELRWPRLHGSLRPLQYALGIQLPNTASPVVLNEPRPGGGFVPYVPARRPDGDVDNEQVVTFVDNARPAPLTGSRTDSYMCAALDVFGRWSPWVAATHLMAQDPPPLPPQILKASFTTQDKKAVPGRIVFATIEVELAWDWEDRSPADWRLVGGFFDPAGAPPAAAPTSFHTTQGTSGMQDPVKIVLFSPDNVSAPGSGGQFVPLPVKATDGEVRRYKFTRPFFELDFGAAAKLAYAVYAQSNHKVDPTRFGPFSAPVVARVNDPLPAAPPAVQPAINWTALPDATGVARARLTFGGDASHASGYVVYEASETAIRAATGLGPPPKTGQGSTISARADVLKQIAGTTKAMDTFARVHPQLLPVPAVEVTLPAAVDGLYAYTFTSVTAEQVESARSAVTLVAVPRQITPGAPGLRVRPEEGRVRIRVVPGPGAPPAGVALHRVASPALASALDLMGPPLFDRDAPAWHKDADGTFTLLDPVPASWRPYFYRAVAYGKDEPAEGRRAGRSAPSAVMDVQVPPVASPDLTAPVVSKATNPALLRVQVRSGADIRVSPLGVHRLRLATANRSGPVPKEELQAEAILPTAPPRAQPPVEALHQLTRGDRDGAGRYLYEGYVPLSDADVLVRLADPLGRVSTQRAVLAPDLLGLLASASGSSLTVSVRSAAPVTPPPSGAFLLELFQEGLKGLVLLCQAQLHTIGTAPLPGQFVRSGPLPDGRFIYAITLPVTVTSGSGSLRVVAGPEGPPGSVQMRLTAPLGFQRELTANVVFGGEEA